METTAFGKVRLVAGKPLGLAIRFLSNPNTYLFGGAWIYLRDRVVDLNFDPETLFYTRYWSHAAAVEKEGLVLFGGMYAICRISRAIEGLKAPTESKAPRPE
jgi:hypothetical protein